MVSETEKMIVEVTVTEGKGVVPGAVNDTGLMEEVI